MSEPAFKAHLSHCSDERRRYEVDMLEHLGEGMRPPYTVLACGAARYLAPECDATTEP